MKRPPPETVKDLAEICKHVTYAGPAIELCARAFWIRMEKHCGDLDLDQLTPEMLKRPINSETKQIYEEIRTEWERFRDAMTKVFGE